MNLALAVYDVIRARRLRLSRTMTMSRWWRTGATLVVGVGVGAAVTRLLSPNGGKDEQDGVGLLGRLPVLPVPSVEASELAVCIRVSL